MARIPHSNEEDRRREEFRRMVVLSAAAHLGVLGLVVAVPMPHAALAPPSVIAVDLVSLPSPQPTTKAAPQAVAPPPPPPPPEPKKIVLPEKPRSAEPSEKPKPKKPRRREVVLEPKPKVEKSLDDLLSEFREETGEAPPAPPTPEPSATVATAVPSGGPGRPASPEVLDWVRRAKRHVRSQWVVPPGFRTQALETHVVLTLDAAGNVRRQRIERRSGNPWYDEGVVRGIEKSSPLPPPPEPGDWDFVFVPEDSY